VTGRLCVLGGRIAVHDPEAPPPGTTETRNRIGFSGRRRLRPAHRRRQQPPNGMTGAASIRPMRRSKRTTQQTRP